jgi:hypothetical protein
MIYKPEVMASMSLESQKMVEEYIYITKWANETERYVRFDSEKKDFVKVDLGNAQRFHTKEDAENFAEKVRAYGYRRPEIVPVEVKPIA